MKTIEVNPLDPVSIRNAITALKEHEAERKTKIQEYIRKLCEVGAEAARQAYGAGSVHVDVSADGQGIIALGTQVIFLEFGAGVYTTEHELSNPLPITIAPGSYSETEGAHMWSIWQKSGRPMEEWPYNKEPRAGMLEAYKAIIAAQERIAEEVFGK